MKDWLEYSLSLFAWAFVFLLCLACFAGVALGVALPIYFAITTQNYLLLLWIFTVPLWLMGAVSLVQLLIYIEDMYL